MEDGLTIPRLSLQDHIALHDGVADAWPVGHEELRQSERTDPGWPESLERFRVLAPCVQEDVQSRATIDVDGLDEVQDSVALVVDQESEGNDERLNEKKTSGASVTRLICGLVGKRDHRQNERHSLE